MLSSVRGSGVAGFAIAAGLVVAVLPRFANAMTLEEAVQLAIDTNPKVGAASSNRRAIEQELRQARSFYLPQLDVTAEVGPSRINDSTTRASRGDDYANGSREVYRATLSQRLFDGFETDSRVSREKARLR